MITSERMCCSVNGPLPTTTGLCGGTNGLCGWTKIGFVTTWGCTNDFGGTKVAGGANRDVAAFLQISEQQVANYRFAAVKKLTELIRAAGLSADVFPELQGPREE